MIMEVKTHMQNLFHQLNAILDDWCAQFDLMQMLQMHFTANDRGELLFNEVSLPYLPDLVLEQAHTDPETICFLFTGCRFLKITIQWPEEEAPVIRAVFFGYGSAESADF